MTQAGSGLFDTPLLRRLRKRLDGVAQGATGAPPAALRRLLRELRATRPRLDAAEHAATTQLLRRAAPPLRAQGAHWMWRPPHLTQPIASHVPATRGTEPEPGLKLFHDCPRGQIALIQRRGAGGRGHPPFALVLEAYAFEGSFLSLVLDLPEAAWRDATGRDIFDLAVRVEAERASPLFARLNIRHGPNTADLLRHIPAEHAADGAAHVAFDLAYSRIDADRIEHAWLDLIPERPAMNRITLTDITLARRPRAEP